MAVLRPAHPPARPAATRTLSPSPWQRPARPHACAPVSRCTTVPSRSPPQRLQRCKSFSAALIASSAALIAFDSAPRQQSHPSSPSRAGCPSPSPSPQGQPAAVQRPALTAQGWRGWRSPRWRRRMCSREKWLYISYTHSYSQSRYTTFSLDGSGLSIIGDPSSL